MILSLFSYLTLLSLGLFCTELILILLLKQQIASPKPEQSLYIEQLIHFLEQIEPVHLALYSTVYLLVLKISVFIPVLLHLLISLQVLSLCLDIFLFHLFRSSND